ncbi:zinc finger protein 596-like [Bolinopsis microptera]|uniref:zinc finger protein 596-like n=1 Tax=Bolinopsis microptera TaxID=2820187 RepID=UPI00307AADCF
MAEQEPEELKRDNPKTEMKEIEQPDASSSSCACKLEDGCPEFSNEPFKTEPSTNEDMKEMEMVEQEELTWDDLKIELIEIEQPAASSSSCACKLENGCPTFSNVPFKTEPTTDEDIKEVGYMNLCRSIMKTEPMECKQFQCNLCQESVDHSSSLRSDGECVPDPLETNLHSHICKHSDGQSVHLTTHKPSHNREKPNPCSLCDYRAKKSDHLKKHVLTQTGEKPYPCSLCDFKTSRSDVLKRHMWTHREKPHKCDICNYSAASKNKLVIHKRTHTGEKPHKCDICNYSAAKMVKQESKELDKDNLKLEMKEI